jgi:hypothetical protein
MEQMINMMKNYKNRLFLANHGKRSIVEPLEGVEDSDDDSEEMAEFKFSTAPNSFFFLPMPIGRSSGFYKRAGTALPRPNGFMFPVGRRAYGKRSAGQKMMRNPNGFNFPMGKRYLTNPNGFNFPSMPKRSAPELDLDGNFFGQRGKRFLTLHGSVYQNGIGSSGLGTRLKLKLIFQLRQFLTYRNINSN